MSTSHRQPARTPAAFTSTPSFRRTVWEPLYVHENIARVRKAATCAIKAARKIVSLGGFSSILIEATSISFPKDTTRFSRPAILDRRFHRSSHQKNVRPEGHDLSESTLLIVEQPEMWVPAAPVV